MNALSVREDRDVIDNVIIGWVGSNRAAHLAPLYYSMVYSVGLIVTIVTLVCPSSIVISLNYSFHFYRV